ncbi:MAG: phosphotriesterase-related protein [Chloroflexi bacterium]|nr:phosphotriesterase-related protein [Chloroflexota bacterium]
MPTVNTVKGPVDTSRLGFTLMHEHVIIRSWGVYENWPHLWDEKKIMDEAVQKLNAAKSTGVDTILELTTVDLGRDIPRLKRIAERVNLNIICATGVWMDPQSYLRRQDSDKLCSMFVHDIVEGVAGTGVKAGCIKVASEPAVDEVNEKILRAAARAHRRTGVPISTHTLPRNKTGTKQQDVFESEGVDHSRVVIGHSGDCPDIDYLETILKRGSYIGMDRFGIESPITTQQRVDTIAALCKRGHANRMVLSHDSNCHMDILATLPAYRDRMPNWNYHYLHKSIIPMLKTAGATQQQIDTMTRDNPRKFFEKQGAY